MTAVDFQLNLHVTGNMWSPKKAGAEAAAAAAAAAVESNLIYPPELK